MGGITPEQNVEGTLVVSIYDAKEKSLIWRGIGTLSNNGNKNKADAPESRGEDVQAVAEELRASSVANNAPV
jgi:hypothetical protein